MTEIRNQCPCCRGQGWTVLACPRHHAQSDPRAAGPDGGLVERLRSWAGDYRVPPGCATDLRAAADEIERLREAIREIVAARVTGRFEPLQGAISRAALLADPPR